MKYRTKQIIWGKLFFPDRDPMDHVLFHYPDRTPYTLRDLTRNLAIFGATGSGKSSGSNLLVARSMLKLPKSGGLILVSKPEDRGWWVDRFKEAGRLKDLIVFGPDSNARCNFIDFELKCGGDSRSLTQFLIVTAEAIGGESRSEEKFWKLGEYRLLYHSIEALRQSGEAMTMPNLASFISTALYSQDQLKTPELKQKFLGGYHNKVMMAADKRSKSDIEKNDFAAIVGYFGNEFLHMDNKPRSSIVASGTNTLFTYNTGVVREMVSTITNVSPEVMEEGKWIMVDFPLDVYGDSGKIIMHGMKFLTQKFILRRHAKPDDAVIVIHADEAQEMVSSFDSSFLAKCRSHLGCMIYLTQSIHSYLGGMGHGEHKAFLTNFGTKIFHLVGDGETAQYASSLLGQRRESFVSVSPKADVSLGEEMFGNGGVNSNFSESYQPVLQPMAFMSGLRSGGPANKFMVDGISISTTRFLNGENYQYVAFSQR